INQICAAATTSTPPSLRRGCVHAWALRRPLHRSIERSNLPYLVLIFGFVVGAGQLFVLETKGQVRYRIVPYTPAATSCPSHSPAATGVHSLSLYVSVHIPGSTFQQHADIVMVALCRSSALQHANNDFSYSLSEGSMTKMLNDFSRSLSEDCLGLIKYKAYVPLCALLDPVGCRRRYDEAWCSTSGSVRRACSRIKSCNSSSNQDHLLMGGKDNMASGRQHRCQEHCLTCKGEDDEKTWWQMGRASYSSQGPSVHLLSGAFLCGY
ncbi:hypothetical protein EJB05_43212, partial [Eragrostis curvula]